MIARALQCPVFVGREAELDALNDARRALAQSRGSIVLVSGEAGIGKSRLVRQFLHSVGRDPRTRNLAVAQCIERGRLPFGPIRDLIAGLRVSGGTKVATTPDVSRALEQLRPAHTGAVGTANALEPGELFSGIAGFFQAFAVSRATILAIEDIHWADVSSFDFLTYLAPRIANSRLLVVATYRSENVETNAPLLGALARLSREPTVARIAVEPLGARDMQLLIDGTLDGRSDLDGAAKSTIVSRAEGNPFYAEELLKHAVESQMYARGATLPISIRGAILERLAVLSPDERRIVTHAAVLGQRFEPEILALTLGTGVDDVLPALRRGRDLNIFVEEDTRPARFRFRHALTRQAVYDDVLHFDARRLHERLLLTLEGLGDSDRYIEALAYHATAAHDATKALLYSERAGEAALAMRALPEARAAFERALEAAASLDDRVRLCGRIASVCEIQGEARQAIARYETALAAQEERGDFDGAARTVAAIANNMNNLRDFTCVAYGMTFLARVGARLSRGPRDALLATLARLSTIQYDYDRAERLLAGVERPGELVPMAQLNYFLAHLHVQWGAGDVESFRNTAQTLLDGVALAPTPVNAMTILYIVAQDASSLGCDDIADEAFVRAERIEGGAAFLAVRAFGEAVRALHCYMHGDLDGARTFLDLSLAASDIPVARMARWFVAPLVALATGEAPYVSAADERGLDELCEHARVGWDAKSLANYAAWKLAAGRMAEARNVLCIALRCLTRPVPGSALALALAAEHLSGEDLEPLHAILDAKILPDDIVARANVTLARAILGRRAGHPERATADALDAARDYRELGWPFFEARALEVAARPDDACEIYARLGAAADVARLRPERAVLVKPRDAALTGRERTIAELVARGETNADVAARLGISVKTVEKHVTAIFAKLGVRNRAQIAAHFAPQSVTG